MIQDLVNEANKLTSTKKVTFEAIEKLEEKIVKLIPELNRLELQDLQERLKKDDKITPQVAEEVMNDWALIGTGVKYNMHLLEEPQKLRILEVARNRSLLDSTLENVKKLRLSRYYT